MSNTRPLSVFISYHQDPAYEQARHLELLLLSTFENIEVFRDGSSMGPGDKLTEEITAALHKADLFLLVLNEKWLIPVKDEGNPLKNCIKLFRKNDWVRQELELAYQLEQKRKAIKPGYKLIIPVLFDGAMLPNSKAPEQVEELPVSLRFFTNEIVWASLESYNHSDEQKFLTQLNEMRPALVRRDQDNPRTIDPLERDMLYLKQKESTRTIKEGPYLGIDYFTAQDAPLFFGRNAEIAEMWEQMKNTSQRLILLYGYSGVGKSSFLRAGLLPRVKAKKWEVYIEKRQANQSLEKTLNLMLDQVENNDIKTDTVIVIDQVEEAIVDAKDNSELSSFIKLIDQKLKQFPALRIMLGFRKEYLAEINKQINEYLKKNNAYGHLLEPLSNESIISAIQLNERLRQQFNFNFEPDLVDKIADSTKGHRLSQEKITNNRASWLQILLSELWKTAINDFDEDDHSSSIIITQKHFKQVKKNNFREIVREQLFKMEQAPERDRHFFVSGLTLNILQFLITASRTSATKRDQLLVRHFPITEEDLIRHLRRLEDFQLVRRIEHSRENTWLTRLAHDSLAPEIIKIYNDSDAPGIRATRIIQSKEKDIESGKNISFSESDIEILKEGQIGMRKLTEDEERYIAESKAKQEEEKTAFINNTKQAIDLLLESAKQHLYQLDVEKALGQLQVAARFKQEGEKVSKKLLEIVFFYNIIANKNTIETRYKAVDLFREALTLVNHEQLLKRVDNFGKERLDKDRLGNLIHEYDPAIYKQLYTKYFPVMIDIEAGNYQTTPKASDNSRVLNIDISAFRLAKYPITFSQFGLYCRAKGKNIHDHVSSWGIKGDTPIINVSWYDAIDYCNWLSKILKHAPAYRTSVADDRFKGSAKQIYWQGLAESRQDNRLPQLDGFRLPTSAEWEYAARSAGAEDLIYAGSNDLNEVGHYQSNASESTAAIGKFPPNKKGLFDMSGNVWEWCWDWYKTESSANLHLLNPTGPTEATDEGKLIRGGGYNSIDEACAINSRYFAHPGAQKKDTGFRVAHTIIK